MAAASTAESSSAERVRLVALATAIALPLALVVLLRGAPTIDERWENTPAHFWLVLVDRPPCASRSRSRSARRAGAAGTRGCC